MSAPVRMCLVCRTRRLQGELIRLNLGPDRKVVLETGLGRSAYLCRDTSCIGRAAEKGKLERAFRGRVDAGCVLALLTDSLSSQVSGP